MEKFKILNNQISIEKDFYKYVSLINKKNECLYIHNNNFLEFLNNTPILNTFEKIGFRMSEFQNFIDKSFQDIANIALNMLIDNEIFDKNIDDILTTSSSIMEYNTILLEKMKNLQALRNERDFALEQSKEELWDNISQQYEGQYDTDIYISDPWTLTFLEMSQESHNRKIDRRKAFAFKIQSSIQTKQITSEYNEQISQIYSNLMENIHPYTEAVICEIFETCFNILVEKNKISRDVLNHFQIEKSKTILDNVRFVQDNKIRNEQLILSLQSNLLNKNVHKEIIDSIIKNDMNSMQEYIKLIKYIKAENIVVNICEDSFLSKSIIRENYFKLLKSLENFTGEYLSKISIKHVPTNDILEEIQTVKNFFDILKSIWSDDNSILLTLEESLLNNIVQKIVENFKVPETDVIFQLDYVSVTNFFQESKQNYIMNQLKREKNIKNFTIGFIISLILIILLIIFFAS